MRRQRSLVAVPCAALLLSCLVVLGLSAPAQAAEHQLEACAPGVPRPCVLTFTRNGADPGPDFELAGIAFQEGGRREVSMSIIDYGSSDQLSDLGAAARADTWSVTLDMGSWKPSIVTGKGRDAVVTRNAVGGGYQVTIAARPVLLAGQCDQSEWPWRCPEADVVVNDPAYFNNVQWDGLWSMQIYDAGFLSDADVREAIYGLEYFHNFAASAIPPSVEFDSDDVASLVIDIANRRYLDDLSTLVIGHAELRVPNRFLQVAYGVPDPASMTSAGLAVSGSGSGATVSVAQEEATDSMRVVIDNVTFPDIEVPDGELRASSSSAKAKTSAKTLKVKRGVITPSRVKVAKTLRVTRTKGRVTAVEAKARGAKVTGYQAKCVSKRSTVTAKGKKRTVVVTGLRPGLGYTCTVRALSKAGPGAYGKKKGLAARP